MDEAPNALEFVATVSALTKARAPPAAVPRANSSADERARIASESSSWCAESLRLTPQRLEAGEAEISAAVRAAAEATAALEATERATEAAKARLAERTAETAKYATKVAEYRAVLAQRAAAPHPLAAGREARARVLAQESGALESEQAAFLARCAAFQAAHDPAAVTALHAQAVAAAAAAQREAAALQEQAQELRASASRAADDARGAEERNRELAATCAGALLTIPARAAPRLFLLHGRLF